MNIYVYMYTHHIFIHSSIDGHLGCFHILTVVNSSTVTLGCIYPFKLVVFFFFLDMYIEVELLGQIEVLFLVY